MHSVRELIFFITTILLFVTLVSATVPSRKYNKGTTVNVYRDNDECELSQDVIDDIASYANVTEEIINYVTKGPLKGWLWQRLAYFVDKFGPRFTGTQNLEDAIDYMITVLEENNLENIRTQNVEVPYWSRGDESLVMLQPRQKKLNMLGLGLSVATPPEGITAAPIVVRSFDELDALPLDRVEGKIVVFNQPFTSYGETGQYRMLGAIQAAKKGAVAALVRSITPFSLATPHTGILTYEDGVTRIPGAAITVEDAKQLWRMQERNETITLKLVMPSTLEEKVSRDTIGELTGSSLPNNIVLVSGHIDSWDVADGAMDNGGGSFIAWLAPVVLKQLNLRPKRTIRTILWTGEEVGIFSLFKYRKQLKADDEFLNFAMDSDLGTFTPRGLMYQGVKSGECMVKEVLKLFKSINATEMTVSNDFDIPLAGLLNENDKYFWYHHTEADTMTVIDPDDLDLCAAFWAALSYVIADMNNDIPHN